MKSLETKVAPWLKGKSAYLSPHIDRAWEHQDLARMMSNEFPLPPAESVREAIEKYGAIGNRYPDAGAIVRSTHRRTQRARRARERTARQRLQ